MRGWSIRSRLVACMLLCCSLAASAADAAAPPDLHLTGVERAWLAAHPVLRVATKQDWAPIDVYSYEGQFRGLSGDLLHVIEERLGRRFDYVAMPTLADGLAALREGRVDVLPSVSRSPSRETFMRFTQAYLDVPNIYLARRGVGPVGENRSLEGMKVAVERGYAVVDTVRERHPKARIVTFDNSAAALRGVSQGAADVYLGALPTTTFLVEKLLLTNLEIRAPWHTALSALHLGVGRDNAILQNILDKALESVSLGERQEIHRRWVPLRTLLAEPATPLPLAIEERRFLQQLPALRVGYDEGHYPYTFRGPEGELAGMAKDYLQLLTRQLGISTGVARSGTWSDMYEAARAGKVDLLVAVSDNAERRADFIFIGPWTSTPTVLVTRQGTTPVLDLRQLNGRSVGVLANGQHEYLMRSRYPEVRLVHYPTRDALLLAAQSGEVDGSISNLSFVVPRLQEGLGASLKMAGMFPELNSDLYFAVRRDQPMLAALLERALRSLSESERAAVASRWAVVAVDAPSAREVVRQLLPFVGALLVALVVSLVWGLRLRRQVGLRRDAESALERSRDEAQNLALARQEFITVASHEIRTPVNAVIGALEHVKCHPDGPRREELLALAERNAVTLREFVNNLLDLSKSDAGMLRIYPEPADLRGVLGECVQSLQSMARLKGIAIELVLAESIAPRLALDSVRLRQVVLNLLSNAVKHTTQGGITLQVQLAAEDETSQTLALSVTDSGSGIPPAALPTLFQRYAQAETDASARHGSTGLGLQLCKRLVEAMGGSIALTSRLGEGTVVRMELRFARAALPAAPPQAAAQTLDGTLRVLVAEDDRVQQIVISSMLALHGCVVDIAEDGARALTLWREQRHALVLTDCRMPGQDGRAFVRALRTQPGGHGVLVAGMSADIDDAKQAVADGMDVLLQKPLTPLAVHDLLERLKTSVRA